MRLNPEAELKELQRELERMGNPWTAGRSPVFDLPPREKLRRLGCISGPDEPSPSERERLAAVNQVVGKLEPTAAYPPFKDWAVACFGNTCGDAITAGDQGSCGSCVAFAVAGALLLRAQITFNTWLNYVRKNETVVSTAYLFYCLAAREGRKCSNGWWITSAINATKGGVPKWQFFPYTPGDQPCNVRTPWDGWKAGRMQTFNKTADMKQYIAANGPLVAQFSVYSDFYDYKKGVYRKSSGATYKGEHAVCVIGYSDEAGAWHCVNSWGWDWGEYGFFWIGYGQCGIDAGMYSMDDISTANS